MATDRQDFVRRAGCELESSAAAVETGRGRDQAIRLTALRLVPNGLMPMVLTPLTDAAPRLTAS